MPEALRVLTERSGGELLAAVGRIGDDVVTVLQAGGPAAIDCPPLRVLRPLIAAGVTDVLLLHTHPAPGGPSSADHAVTRRLRAACALLGVTLAGHIVVDPVGEHVCDGSMHQTGAAPPPPPAGAPLDGFAA